MFVKCLVAWETELKLLMLKDCSLFSIEFVKSGHLALR